jgi:uncharacterized membrane protein
MSALTVILGIWAMVAFCAILFIRGASPRVARVAKAPKSGTSRYSIAE